jgi:guanylate kinase
MGRLVILSGPSCVGKGPLVTALRKFHPELAGQLTKIVLYDSRAPRPGEVDGVDFHFRSRQFIEALRGREGFNVFECRGDIQALDSRELERKLAVGDVLFEGNPFIGSGLLDFVAEHGTPVLSLFLSPLSRQEVLEFHSPERAVSLSAILTDMMRRKLLRRTARHKGLLSLKDLENIEVRAGEAYGELQQAWRFDHVIVNHDGEDSENWDAFYCPAGDARKTLLVFTALLQGWPAADVEKWEQGLVP